MNGRGWAIALSTWSSNSHWLLKCSLGSLISAYHQYQMKMLMKIDTTR
ncbi:MAG: hypothetical protein ACUVT7_06850 [Thermoplasmata archaeon]